MMSSLGARLGRQTLWAARPRPAHEFGWGREGGSQSTRTIHSSRQRHARAADFYSVLEVGKDASQRDIKMSFYQLSKRYHPDVNPNDETAHAKFQELSEAYATLGDQRKRREYDSRARMAPASSGAGSTGSSGWAAAGAYQGYTYDPEANANRRARASYAWDYQRRRADSVRSARGAARSAGASQQGGDARFSSAAFGFGSGGVGSSTSGEDAARADRFEELAARERRKEQAASARGGPAAAAGVSASASTNEDESSIPAGRFLQVTAVFAIILLIGNKAGQKEDPPSRVKKR